MKLKWEVHYSIKNFLKRVINENGDKLVIEVLKSILDKKVSIHEFEALLENMNFFKIFEKTDNKEALTLLGLMHFDGFGVQLNLEKAGEYFRTAGEQNYGPALICMGDCYNSLIRGYGYNPQKALEYYKLAVEQGESSAANALCTKYEQGLVVTEDFNKSLEYLTFSAEKDDALALRNLGMRFFLGSRGVKQDGLRALELFKRSALLDPIGTYALGTLYYQGCPEIEINLFNAFQYFFQAAELEYSKALTALGAFYFEGSFVSRSLDCAMLAHKAAKNNESRFNQDSGFNLNAYDFFKKCESEYPEIEQAISFYENKKSKNNDCPKAYRILGFCYHLGLGVDQNIMKASEYYHEAMKRNGSCYVELLLCSLNMLNNNLIDKDTFQDNCRKIRKELENSSHKNELSIFLGFLYESGFANLDQNLDKARMYYWASSKTSIFKNVNEFLENKNKHYSLLFQYKAKIQEKSKSFFASDIASIISEYSYEQGILESDDLKPALK